MSGCVPGNAGTVRPVDAITRQDILGQYYNRIQRLCQAFPATRLLTDDDTVGWPPVTTQVEKAIGDTSSPDHASGPRSVQGVTLRRIVLQHQRPCHDEEFLGVLIGADVEPGSRTDIAVMVHMQPIDGRPRIYTIRIHRQVVVFAHRIDELRIHLDIDNAGRQPAVVRQVAPPTSLLTSVTA